MKKVVVLLSGGLDSAVVLYFAKRQGYKINCLIFDYGQRHKKEIESAKRLAQAANSKFQVLKIDLPWKGSSLLDRHIKVPLRVDESPNHRVNKIPSTYVPARNTIFLSFATSFAEAIGAKVIFLGAHIQDYSGYPDCRVKYLCAFNKVIKTGTWNEQIRISSPLIKKTKAEIIKLGQRLNVPFKLTWSCYQGGKRPCGRCDSCYFRAKGFQGAGIKDPLYER